jgi:hypothetical protein
LCCAWYGARDHERHHRCEPLRGEDDGDGENEHDHAEALGFGGV